uniref:Small ribosomal subunit protein uS7 domain-containing protein n=1 Tax=Biomphalaria glabrata TaxID=6526 RepID=A0A2C9LYY7_BIOGL
MAEQKLSVGALEIFKKALENVRPLVDVRSRRVGGATYQVPMDVSHDHSMIMGMRFLVQSARKRSDHSMINKLLSELMDAYNNKGNAVKLREDRHKVAEANKAFSQFRW